MSQRSRVLATLTARYERIGPFRLRRFDELLGIEIEHEEIADRQLNEHQLASMNVIDSFARDKGIDVVEATRIVQEASKQGETKVQELLGAYSSQLIALSLSQPAQATRIRALVTLILNTRGEIQAEGGNEEQWEKIEAWGEDDTRALPGEWINAIWSFAMNEKGGWPEKRPEPAADDRPPRISRAKAAAGAAPAAATA
jgi:hypothetical protein